MEYHVMYVFYRLMGKPGRAKRLLVGYHNWTMMNSPCADTNLTFNAHALLQLAARLDAKERSELLLVWTPKGGAYADTSISGTGSMPVKATIVTSQAIQQEKGPVSATVHSIDGHDTCNSVPAGDIRTAGVDSGCNNHNPADACTPATITWQRYANNTLAGVYKALYGVSIPQQKTVTVTHGGQHKRVVVQHNFKAIA